MHQTCRNSLAMLRSRLPHLKELAVKAFNSKPLEFPSPLPKIYKKYLQINKSNKVGTLAIERRCQQQEQLFKPSYQKLEFMMTPPKVIHLYSLLT